MSKENKTLFIRNLPFSTNKETLEDIFSDYGPIKQCFIVTDRGTGRSKGFGYVQFTLRDDAIKAKDAVRQIDGRNVFVDYADITRKKTKNEKLEDRTKRRQGFRDGVLDHEDEKLEDRTKRRQGFRDGFPENRKDVEDVDDEDGREGNDDTDDRYQDDESETEVVEVEDRNSNIKDSSPKKADLKYHRAKIVVLGGLPTDCSQEEVGKCLQKLKVKHVAEVKLTGGQVHVKFRSIREAKNGIRKLHNKIYKDHELTAVQLSEVSENIPQSVLKRSRLIVRNLSFKCNEEELRQAFESCEGMSDVSIPVKPDGKKLGFGFVQFTSLRNAMRAVEQMNATEILGRPVAVDWLLPKDKYQANQSNKNQSMDVQEEKFMDVQEEKSSPLGKRKVFEEDSSDDDGSSNADGDDDDDDDDSHSGNSQEKQDQSQEEENSDDDDDDDDDDSEEDDPVSDGNDSETEVSSNKRKKAKAKNTSGKPGDVDQGKTIFIRNLSFDRTDEGLEEHFSQYGGLVYCRVVIDPQTEHSKGMGFVKFKSKESAEKCLEEAQASGIVLDGRQLIVSLAVSREESTKFNEKKKKEKKDNRNLYLAREGMIRPGTQAAEGLSKVDLDKRMKVESVKRQKLKNDNIFISPYRLCVRNIPSAVDDKQLKKVYLKAAGDKSAVITESRIMRDFKGATGKSKGKPLGYGFVCFKEHQHALAALRHTNNNAEIFGENKRLIVEFSLENRKALEAKERRWEKLKTKQEAQKLKSTEKPSTQKVTKTGKSAKVGLLTLSENDKKLKGDKPAGKKGMPSHWGPKVRHKPRPGQQNQKKAGKKGKKGRKMEGKKDKGPLQMESKKRNLEGSGEGPERKKRKRNMYKDAPDSFEKMVNKYKKKITTSKSDHSKWFE